MKANLVPKQVPVYQYNTPFSADPDGFLDETEARLLVKNGNATRINHGRAIRLYRTIRAGSGECGSIADAIRRLHMERGGRHEQSWS